MKQNLTTELQELARRTDALLAAQVLSGEDGWADSIRLSVDIELAAQRVVRAVVQRAREQGTTWQVVGDALGISRQAAFQRYGRPTDPRTGEPMNTTPLPGAAELAAAVVHDLVAARWSQITEQFDPTMRDNLSEDGLSAAWAQIVGLAGALEEVGEPETTRAGDLTITSTPLAHEAGDYTARIAFRDDKTIAGLHILERETS